MSGMIRFIDLFAGIGGFRIGMENNDLKCVFSSEIDTYCRNTYLTNFGELPSGDITQINERFIPEHEILCAGFPCQPFSVSGNKLGFEDTRGTLFFDILRIAQSKKPRVIFLENVKHLVHHDKGRTLKTIINKLESLGYTVNWEVLNAKDFGVPQNRERIIIIGNIDGLKFDFSRVRRHKEVFLKDFLDPKGDFEYLSDDEYTLIENPKKQKSGLIFVGYRNKKIRRVGVRPNTKHLSRVHKQPNRIYSVEGVHPTLPAQETSGRFWVLHEEKVRKLTISECYRIMGFPENYIKVGPLSEQYKQIGNSICVPMVEEIGKQIVEQFFKEDERCLPRENYSKPSISKQSQLLVAAK